VNSESDSTNARQNSNLYLHSLNLAIYQKRISYYGIRLFNSLPSHIKNMSDNTKQFKSALKSFLIPSTHSMNTSMQIKNGSSRFITLIVPFLLPIVILTFSLAPTCLNQGYSNFYMLSLSLNVCIMWHYIYLNWCWYNI